MNGLEQDIVRDIYKETIDESLGERNENEVDCSTDFTSYCFSLEERGNTIWYSDDFSMVCANVAKRLKKVNERFQTVTSTDILACMKFEPPTAGDRPDSKTSENECLQFPSEPAISEDSRFPRIGHLRRNTEETSSLYGNNSVHETLDLSLYNHLSDGTINATANANVTYLIPGYVNVWETDIVCFSHPFDTRLTFEGYGRHLTRKEEPDHVPVNWLAVDHFNCFLCCNSPSTFVKCYLTNYRKYIRDLCYSCDCDLDTETDDFVSTHNSDKDSLQNNTKDDVFYPSFVSDASEEKDLWNAILSTKYLWSDTNEKSETKSKLRFQQSIYKAEPILSLANRRIGKNRNTFKSISSNRKKRLRQIYYLKRDITEHSKRVYSKIHKKVSQNEEKERTAKLNNDKLTFLGENTCDLADGNATLAAEEINVTSQKFSENPIDAVSNGALMTHKEHNPETDYSESCLKQRSVEDSVDDVTKLTCNNIIVKDDTMFATEENLVSAPLNIIVPIHAADVTTCAILTPEFPAQTSMFWSHQQRQQQQYLHQQEQPNIQKPLRDQYHQQENQQEQSQEHIQHKYPVLTEFQQFQPDFVHWKRQQQPYQLPLKYQQLNWHQHPLQVQQQLYRLKGQQSQQFSQIPPIKPCSQQQIQQQYQTQLQVSQSSNQRQIPVPPFYINEYGLLINRFPNANYIPSTQLVRPLTLHENVHFPQPVAKSNRYSTQFVQPAGYGRPASQSTRSVQHNQPSYTAPISNLKFDDEVFYINGVPHKHVRHFGPQVKSSISNTANNSWRNDNNVYNLTPVLETYVPARSLATALPCPYVISSGYNIYHTNGFQNTLPVSPSPEFEYQTTMQPPASIGYTNISNNNNLYSSNRNNNLRKTPTFDNRNLPDDMYLLGPTVVNSNNDYDVISSPNCLDMNGTNDISSSAYNIGTGTSVDLVKSKYYEPVSQPAEDVEDNACVCRQLKNIPMMAHSASHDFSFIGKRIHVRASSNKKRIKRNKGKKQNRSHSLSSLLIKII